MTSTSASMSPSPSGSRLSLLGAWARKETTGGVLLGLATLLALVLANSPAAAAYERVRDVAFGPESLHLHLTVGQWTADGLLAVFFFVVGVELKRELVAGDLSDLGRAIVPVAAAVGGVAVPVLIYLAVVGAAGDSDALAGWAVPAATDIAFAVAVLALVARNLPAALRTFLLTLAVVDDLIAITIIAVGYSSGIDVLALVLALVAAATFAFVVQGPARWVPVVAVPIALAAWGFMHASGVHATIAGVLLGLAVPAFPAGARPTDAERCSAAEHGPTARVEHALQPWSACLAVPSFAFFAAGVPVGGLGGYVEAVTTPVALGIIAGLVLGKTVGITLATFLVTRVRGVTLDPELRWGDVTGAAMLGGIGFTVSLLVGDLAFGTDSHLDEEVKVGVLTASLLASILALTWLWLRSRSRGASSRDRSSGRHRGRAHHDAPQ